MLADNKYPEYISQAPWYLDTGAPSLAHQRRRAEDAEVKPDINQWYARGQRAGPAATKYRKGACENCGAMTHKRADCMERPRKKGAKFTGKDIAADEIIQDIQVGYDAKRDRWNGYDPSEHKKVYEEYAALEAARQKKREEEIDNQTTTDLAAVKKLAKAGGGEKDPDFGSSDEDDADEDKYADAADAVGQKLDTKTRITVRNLRIREDTAKYLINLDPDSAYYDPKTRSMRDAPDKSVPPEDVCTEHFIYDCTDLEQAKFAGDNFLRHTGDALAAAQLQVFAWQASQRGNDVDLHANPTAGEIYHQEFTEKKEKNKKATQVSILDKYGGEQYLQKAPKELLMGQTEAYVEYSRTGQVIKGKERAKARSKYQEDLYINNHTQIWGSWYDVSNRQWGYACCHSTVHASYCTGEAGIAAAEASSHTMMLKVERAKIEAQKKQEEAAKQEVPGSKRLGEANPQLDPERLARAIKEERKRKAGDEEEWMRDKRRKYGGGMDVDVTEEDLEAYRINRLAGTEDPMYNYKDVED
ncbi:related to step II splicing factor SLU7 [Serendipita indica DSM 11827]|uniref:Pre-mRNA-splicing factor SLU7 n=1 Tax=Serendipita indica (strain DSM 11827) TaxID=1109443 RepID=G4TL23_SERID|nr:related to step II splicing factor SLU7 [Serendipita indica DSM 11827]